VSNAGTAYDIVPCRFESVSAEKWEASLVVTQLMAAKILALSGAEDRIAALEHNANECMRITKNILTDGKPSPQDKADLLAMTPLGAREAPSFDGGFYGRMAARATIERNHWKAKCEDRERTILDAIKAGKVPGFCTDNDPNALARRLASDLVKSETMVQHNLEAAKRAEAERDQWKAKCEDRERTISMRDAQERAHHDQVIADRAELLALLREILADSGSVIPDDYMAEATAAIARLEK
jgi:hypothetical protein